jgi:hypothetical protein
VDEASTETKETLKEEPEPDTKSTPESKIVSFIENSNVKKNTSQWLTGVITPLPPSMYCVIRHCHHPCIV